MLTDWDHEVDLNYKAVDGLSNSVQSLTSTFNIL